MNKDFRRLSKSELEAIIKGIDEFSFDSAHGFTETSYGCTTDLGSDELNGIIRSSADMFEACYKCYKYGFMTSQAYNSVNKA